MEENYELCEDRVLADEGGYTNDPHDPGGPTNWGITIYDARKYWNPKATAQDVRNMPISVAKDIYHSKYWLPMMCDKLNGGVEDSVFDYGVNSGLGRSGRVLRKLVGLLDDDYHITQQVVTAANKRDPKQLINAINDERMNFLRNLSTWQYYGRGWSKRVEGVRKFSLDLADRKRPPPTDSHPDTQTAGKGQIPQPTGTKTAIAVGGTGAAATTAWSHWLADHHITPLVILLVGLGIVIAVVALINYWYKNKQTAPMPGTPVVPETPPPAPQKV